MKQNLALLLLPLLAAMIAMIMPSMDVDADRNNKPHDGNNGQCKKLQKTFPEELQDFEGCHDTFTGKGHKDPEPLP